MRNFYLFLSFLLLIASACQNSKSLSNELPSKTELVFLHINDVYEIAPLANGSVGGMARVASLRKELLKANPNTYTVLAGDFVSPSVIGTVELDGKRINGAQMVDVMNHTGVDFVTFGNHEFDIKEEEIQARINESQFDWISSNTFHRTSKGVMPFIKTQNGQSKPLPPYKILMVPAGQGRTLKVGIIGLCLPFNKQPFVQYEDFYEAARRTHTYLLDKTDFVIGLTHLNIDEDSLLAIKLPELPLIMGGHEHENNLLKVGSVVIAKADANAKSAYIHRLVYTHDSKQLSVSSELKELDVSVPLDPAVDSLVKAWEEKAYANFSKQGFDLNKEIATLTEPLDGLEAHIRTQPTNLGTLITQAMQGAQAGTDLAFLNGGSIRIDDYLSGALTQFDLVRAMPFGGAVYHVDMTGELLAKVLNIGLIKNRGKGGYLQTYPVTMGDDGFLIGGQPLRPEASYRVCLPAFLLRGIETNLEFLKENTPGVSNIMRPGKDDLERDIRLVLIDFLEKE